MDRYQRVEKTRDEEPIKENEIRVTSQGRMRNYISYGISLFEEKGSEEIVFKAMGRAINKTVMIVELVKRRVVGLHQTTVTGSMDITDTWEPVEEGLLPVETTRHVSLITITLSKKELDSSSVGYQPPLPEDQVKPAIEYDNEGENGEGRPRGGRGRGRGRGNNNGAVDSNGRGNGFQRGPGRGYGGRGRRGGCGGRYEEQQDGEYHNEGPGRGYGGGRGRRGGYGGGRYDEQDGEYYNEGPAPAQGRGRGRGRGGRGPHRGRGQYGNSNHNVAYAATNGGA